MRQSVSLKRHWMMRVLGLALLLTVFSGVGQSQSPQPTVITIDTQTVTHSISPYIYGLNFANMTFADEIDLPVNRFGGNATSRYNWQTDTTNLGMDWYFENYPHALQGSSKNPSILPDGSSADNFLAANAANGTATLMVMPTIGWTAAFTDVRCGFSVKKYGAQQATDYQWYPDCGNGIKPNGKFITTNDPLDTSKTIDPAFVQGWVSFISGKYGAAGDANPRFYNLDNEPGLWHETHRDVYPNPISAAELVARSIQYASAIKTIDAGAKILGPVEWGYMAYFYSASDWASYMKNGTRPEYDASGLHQTPFYLKAMKDYEAANGVRILDYLDLHFYPQGQGVALSKAGNAATQALRLRQTRGLWDRNYTDESWINKPIFLIPQMREWVDTYYPGTLLAVSEYNFGGLEHINGAVTQAEVLGIFGRENLHLATLWSPPNPNQPGAFAFRMYRNYDGLGGQYGDQNHPATSTRIHRVSAYASTRSSDGTLTVMLVNKTTSAQALTVNINGDYRQARPYRYSTADLKRVVRLAPLGINNGVMRLTLPAMSITLLEIKPTPASKALLVNGGFENAAQRWTLFNATNDGIRCNVANTPAYEGVCAFNFNGSAKESSRAERLYRNVDGLVAGDTLTLSGYAKGINAQPNAALVALVTYSNGQRETLRVPLAGGTYEYTLFSQSLTLSKPAAVKEILVRLVNTSKSGRVIIDNVALTVQYPASSGALAPLPPAP